MDNGEVEVIVVPNGPDESWRVALMPFKNNQSVRVVRVAVANANVARNAGLSESRGKFVRFLDDDDYLIPDAAIKQYELFLASGADLISGNVQMIDPLGQCLGVLQQPHVNDFCAAVLGPGRVCQPTAHVYNRSRLRSARWNPRTAVRQDVEWMLDLCGAGEFQWRKSDCTVGVWQHHVDDRVSTSWDLNTIRKATVSMLTRTYEKLLTEDRMSKPRRRAIAQGLWGCIHASFFMEPFYWTRVAQYAREVDQSGRPVQPFYDYPIIRSIDPLWVQWLMVPKRISFFKSRKLLAKWWRKRTWEDFYLR